MFKTEDKELWKLAQRICHEKRISYYVKVSLRRYSFFINDPSPNSSRILLGYTLTEDKEYDSGEIGKALYSQIITHVLLKINLNKNK